MRIADSLHSLVTHSQQSEQKLLLCVIVNDTTDTVGLMEAGLLKYQQFSDHDIRVRAYIIWTREGRPDGGPQEFWRRALSELNAECHAAIDGESLHHALPRPKAATPPVRTAVSKQ